MALIDITPEARVDIALAIDICPVEISGIGKVVVEDGIYHITEVTLFPQECYYEHTTMWKEFGHYVHALNMRRTATGIPTEINNQRLWWHSHVWGWAEFSTTDTAYMDLFGADTLLPCNPWLISMVGNKRGVVTTRLDIFKPTRSTTYARLPLSDKTYTREMLRDLYFARKERMNDLVQAMVTVQSGGVKRLWELEEFSPEEEQA